MVVLFVGEEFVLSFLERRLFRWLMLADHRGLEGVLSINLRLQMLPPFLALLRHLFLPVEEVDRTMTRPVLMHHLIFLLLPLSLNLLL